MAIVGQLMVIVAGNNAPLMATLGASQGALKGFAGASSAALNVIKTAAIGAGIATVAGAALGVKAAADFQDAFAGVRKTVDEADLSAAGLTFESLARQFRDMALEIPIAATELAAIGEAAGALGIKAGDIEAFTRTVALLSVTTDLTSDAAATALGKLGTILDLTGGEFAEFGDILVALGNTGASTESEIIEVAKRFAAAGKTAGLSTPEILAFSSAITSAGVGQEAAGTALSRLFGGMVLQTANATSKGKAFASVTGKSFKDFSNLVKNDTVGAMTLFLEKFRLLDRFAQARALKAAGITGSQNINAIQLLAQTYEKNLIPAIETANSATGALSEEAQKKFDTFNSKLTLLGNAFNELFISIGEPLLAPLTGFVQSISAGVITISQSGQQLATTFTPVINAIVAKFQEFQPTLLAVSNAVMDFATRVWEGGLNKALQTGATVISSIIDVLGGLATAIVTNQDVMNILRTTADLIGQGFGLASDAVSNLLGFLGRLGESIRSNEELMRSLAGIGDGIARAFAEAGPYIQEVINAIQMAIDLAGLAADEILRLTGGTPGAPTDRGSELPQKLLLGGNQWPLGPVNTPNVDFGPFKNVLGGDSTSRPPTTLNNTTVVNVDGQKLIEITDRRLFNNASQASSGFNRGALEY